MRGRRTPMPCPRANKSVKSATPRCIHVPLYTEARLRTPTRRLRPAYLLATNHLIALLNRVPAAVDKQRRLEETGGQVCSTTISLGELYFGASHSRHRLRNLRRLSRLRRQLAFLPLDVRAAVEFGRIREETHSRGTPIPVADGMIAAIARPLRLRVLSHDEHFRWVRGLQVEDWLG